MPVSVEQVQRTERVAVSVAQDSAGVVLHIGDDVSLLPFRVTGIREMLDPETGLYSHDLLELGFVKPNGYVLHMGVFDSRMVKKS
jgi:hypothetical protein